MEEIENRAKEFASKKGAGYIHQTAFAKECYTAGAKDQKKIMMIFIKWRDELKPAERFTIGSDGRNNVRIVELTTGQLYEKFLVWYERWRNHEE